MEATEREAVLWSVDDGREHLSAYDIAEALEEWADDLHPAPIPEEVTVHGYAHMELPSAQRIGEDALERALEWLDEDFGDPEGEYTKPNAEMKAAALAFGEAVRKHYTVWSCERVTQETVKTRDYLPAEWFSAEPAS